VTQKLVHQDLFGGRGKVTVELVLENAPPHFECVLRCTLAPKGNVGLHEQEHCDEVVIVLDGRGQAIVDGPQWPPGAPHPSDNMGMALRRDRVTTALKPGVVVPVPLGSRLALINTSKKSPLRYLIVKARP
jgi:mannose-6-phosphate isomerase-like protein (cupin superfamily)